MSQSPPLRLVLADDFAPFLATITRFLERHDCEVVGTVASGAQLLEAATRLQPDAILVDLNMPDLNGLQACQLLKKAQVPAAIIVLTADPDSHVADQAIAAGAVAVVTKQSIGSELIGTIRAACGKSRQGGAP